MSRGGWHLRRDGPDLWLARHWPPRFDTAGRAEFPPLRRAVLAHEIRKDLWRMLARVRGFSPVIRVTRVEGAGLAVTAGGALPPRSPAAPDLAERIEGMLAEARLRTRWIAHARPPA